MKELPSGKRFWDISWDRGEVEITSGACGKNGRSKEHWFRTPQERDAFIEEEIRKKLGSGYVEVDEVAPAAGPAAATQAKVRAWQSRIEPLARAVWTPVFRKGEHAGHGTLRGAMRLSAGESWPACPCCQRPLAPLLELDRRALPDSALRSDSLVQLFVCEVWSNGEPSSGDCILTGSLCREVSPSARPTKPPGEVAMPRDAEVVSLVDWKEHAELPFEPPLCAELDLESDETLLALVHGAGGHTDELDGFGAYAAYVEAKGLTPEYGPKLGGHPTFIQECTVPFSKLLFQLDARAPFNANFGDGGNGQILLKSDGTPTYFWSCS